MSDPAAVPFNLFDQEEKVLESGQALSARLRAENAAPPLCDGVDRLLEAYRKSVREQRRLMRLSDRQQEQLSAVNQELQRRRAEAEQALSSLKEAQDSLIQAEKLASLGALVAGVAHEINTPVGIALASSSHLADATAAMGRLFEDGQLRKSDFADYLATAREASALIQGNCERAAQLINSFKQVAADQTSEERRRFRLADYLHEILLSLSPKLRQTRTETEIDCPPGLELDSYPGALSQIVANLVLNALLHGFGEERGGRIRLAARLDAADMVRLTVEDNGAGIADDIRGRIFDPFFTTRRGQGGNGLGLHIVFNIVTGSLKGHIAVESAPGQGTRFLVDFPRITPQSGPADLGTP
ncbi:sensor protein ZraS [mine drainage metagenome]|uniref:Sensor protein ZraS n=1 Tax=mine drainage metagenome TaxID=410659 RepID=A0A1J5S1H1_9ZZZZ